MRLDNDVPSLAAANGRRHLLAAADIADWNIATDDRS